MTQNLKTSSSASERQPTRTSLVRAIVQDPRNLAVASALAHSGSLAQMAMALSVLSTGPQMVRVDLSRAFGRATQELRARVWPERTVQRFARAFRILFANNPHARAQRPRIGAEFVRKYSSSLAEANPLAAVFTDGPSWDIDPALWKLVQKQLIDTPYDAILSRKVTWLAARANGLERDDREAAFRTVLRSIFSRRAKGQRTSNGTSSSPLRESPYSMMRGLMALDQRVNERDSVPRHWARALRGMVPVPDEVVAGRIAELRAHADRTKIGVYVGDVGSYTARYLTPAIILGLARAGLAVRIYTRSSSDEVLESELYEDTRDLNASFATLDEATEADTAIRIAADRNWAYLDLRGHSRDHMVEVLAARPAPLSIHMIGAGETIGLMGVGALISDGLVLPDDDAHVTERHVVRLIGGVLNIATRDLPCRPSTRAQNAFSVFGAFHNDGKMSSLSLDLWASALHASSDSHIRIKLGASVNSESKIWILRGLQARGIAPERVTLLGRAPSWDAHIAQLDEVDVMLDAFPFNGEMTTLEALWMGVPVVSVAGERMIARYGASILHHAGLPQLCAPSKAAFGDTAASVIEDRAFLARFRADGRALLTASPTYNADLYADSMAAAVNELWSLPVDAD